MERATSNYLKRAAEAAKSGFSSTEDKESCLENVFAVLEEDALHICQIAETSIIVEQFVSIATAGNLHVLYEALRAEVRTVLTDRHASHVLESILWRSTKFITKAGAIKDENVDCPEETNDSENSAGSIEAIIFHLCDVVEEDIGSFLTDSYPSHVLRALLQVLGGTSVESKISRQKKGLKKEQQGPRFSDFEVPYSFRERLKKIGKLIFELQHMNVLLDTHACTVVQTFLLVCHKVDRDRCGKYIKKIIKLSKIGEDSDGSNTNLPPVTTDKVGSFLVQQIMTLASADVYGKLFTKLFKGCMLQYAIHPKANFVLQSLLASCTEKKIFKEQFEELQDRFEDIMAYGHHGVINAIAKTCQRLECKQKDFKQSLMSAFHCRDPLERQKKLFPITLTMRTYEVYFDLPDDEGADGEEGKPENVIKHPEVQLSDVNINYFGSLLLQEMLRFSGTKLVVESLLDMTSADLSTMSCNSSGSYVLETFFQSKTVAKAAKDSFLDIWKGQCVEISCDRIGCQTVWSLWKHFNLDQKSSIAEELCKDEVKLRSDQYGKFVYSTFALQHFKKRRKDWEFFQQEEEKKRKLFTEMTGKEMPHKRLKKGAKDQDSIQETEFTYRENVKLEEIDEKLQENLNKHGGRGQDGHPFRSRGRGDGNFRGRSRGRGRDDGHTRGRGSGGGQYKGGLRGRGDGHSRGGSRGRGRGDRQFRGRTRGRGNEFDGGGSGGDGSFTHRQNGQSNSVEYRYQSARFRGKGSVRGNGNFRGRSWKENRSDFKKNFSDNFEEYNEKGKSGSFGNYGNKKGET